MNKQKIISKISMAVGIVSIVFVVLSAIDTYYLLQIASPTAPTNYVAFYILSNMLPYLFIAAVSLAIAMIPKSVEKEQAAPVQTPEALA
jgi:hypothetical protein